MDCPLSRSPLRSFPFMLSIALSMCTPGCMRHIQTSAHPELLCRDLHTLGINCAVSPGGPRVHMVHLPIASRITRALVASADAIHSSRPAASGAGPHAFRTAAADHECDALLAAGHAWACGGTQSQRILFFGPSGPPTELPIEHEQRTIPLPSLPVPVPLQPVGPFTVGAHQRPGLRVLSGLVGLTLLIGSVRVWQHRGRVRA